MKVIIEGARQPRGFSRALLRFALFLLLVGITGGGMFGLGLYVLLSRDIPNFRQLSDYRPKLVTRLYGQEGQLIGELYREKRIVVPYEEMPRRLVQAFLASEDNRFFDHAGIDYFGILRAAWANLRAGRVVQGGSTITQQVAKSILVGAEGYQEGTAKKLSRKLKEAILAQRLESNLQKQDILTLYLNQIFLGNQAYGIEAAAHNYFRKTIAELNLAELALLGGLPQAPSRYSPFRHPQRAKDRREYVLRRMLEDGFITQAELDEAKETPIVVYPAPDVSREVTPFFTEHVRRLLLDQFGEKTVLEEGLRVHTSVDVERYRGAEDSAYDNLRMVDKRQGYRGALARLEGVTDTKRFLEAYGAELAQQGRAEKLEDGELYVGVITKVDRDNDQIQLVIGPHAAVLPLAAMRWARGVDPEKWFESSLLTTIPKSFKVGDVIQVRTTTLERIKKDRYAGSFLKKLPTDPAVQLVALEQAPALEAALLSVEVHSGYVLAMLGGYSFDRSEFNRAIQSCRQPGSSFKPIVYAAALDLKEFTLATTVLDAPITAYDPSAQKTWKPKNFDVKYLGEVTLRSALQNSMNVPAIRVLEAVGVGDAIQYAKKLGITTELPPELGLALGQGCVTMSDLTEVYRLFANYGKRTERRFITRVYDRDGKLIYDHTWPEDAWVGIGHKVERAIQETQKPPEQVIDRQTGFLITKMMRNVVMGGTGTPAQALGVPVAGKTGTTNDSFDAWFMGFTTEIVTAAWVGYDDYVLPMGKYEQGGRAALPLWLGYMRRAIKGKRTQEFQAPANIVWVRIDPKTGRRARGETAGAVIEAFREGTEPKEFVVEAGEARPDEFGKVDNL
ncbi:MAG: PBP1A family penicillin-binding protein [Deltaproteobacteria bacterium]|nr:PBP1A family penicillin-binding protein [Deltaproteobacteria bacterium]